MRINNWYLLILFFLSFGMIHNTYAGPTGTAVRETAEFILAKFGRGVAGQTVEEIAEATTKAMSRYGEDALPLLRNSGHAGFTALEAAGEKATDVIRLYATKGDEAIWIISEPKKLAIFLKHGDSAADALLKHPGVSDTLIENYGISAVDALNEISRQNAQRLTMLTNDGLFNATPRSTELLHVIRTNGDDAMDFIWKNKGALAVVAVLGTFLADTNAYISGAKELVADPLIEPIARGTNWTLIIAGILVVVFMPFIARSFIKARASIQSKNKT